MSGQVPGSCSAYKSLTISWKCAQPGLLFANSVEGEGSLAAPPHQQPQWLHSAGIAADRLKRDAALLRAHQKKKVGQPDAHFT